jgi:hypothetical protein
MTIDLMTAAAQGVTIKVTGFIYCRRLAILFNN